MSSNRETIHLSLGSTANAISAHYLNLLGLVGTSSELHRSCNPYITHSITSDVYTPRCLFVDQLNPLAEVMDDQSDSLFQQLNQAVTSQYSRFRAPSTAQSCTQQYSTSNGRTVDWDDLGTEEEDEEEEEEEVKKQHRELERQRWQADTCEPMQELLAKKWQQEKEKLVAEQKLDWTRFLAPPKPRNFLAPLNQQDCESSSYMAGLDRLTAWKESVLYEHVRKLLEACDAVQGFTVQTQGHALYAGLTTNLLQELKEQCPSAPQLIIHATDPPTEHDDAEQDLGWQFARSKQIRRSVETGLMLFDIGNVSSTILPVHIGQHDSALGLFRRTRTIATALETATLPYRLTSTPNFATTGLRGMDSVCSGGMTNNGYGTVTSPLLFGEFVASLKPAPRYNLLELDYCEKKAAHLAGTRVAQIKGPAIPSEYKGIQTRQDRYEKAGNWIGASMSTLSPLGDLCEQNPKYFDRSLHQHMSIGTSLRISSEVSSSDHLAGLMESVIVQFRPETVVGTVVRQSVKQLAKGGYAAGTYLERSTNEQPFFSQLSNSTRSYSYAHMVASGIDESFKSKLVGIVKTNVAKGLLPEIDDCNDAIEYCLTLRDTYHPPRGSGLGDDDEGVDFD